MSEGPLNPVRGSVGVEEPGSAVSSPARAGRRKAPKEIDFGAF